MFDFIRPVVRRPLIGDNSDASIAPAADFIPYGVGEVAGDRKYQHPLTRHHTLLSKVTRPEASQKLLLSA